MVTFDSVVHVLVLINMYKERILSKFLRRSSIFSVYIIFFNKLKAFGILFKMRKRINRWQ